MWDRSRPLPLLIATIDGTGTTNIVYGPGRLPVEHTGPAGTRWYHHDRLGSTRMLTDNTGTVTATYAYGAYGTLEATTGTPDAVLTYAGEQADPETGLVYLRARYYDPTTAQFLTRDPLAALTRQTYAYANNNPANFTDPTGELFVAAGLIWAGAEIGLSLWDAYDVYRTFGDGCATGADKLMAGGLLLFGLFAPGGGYGALDDLSHAARALDR